MTEKADFERRVLSCLSTHTAAGAGPVGEAVAWRCFHCDDVFTSEHDARLHFGREEGATPACQIKGSEHGLVAALRQAENEASEAWMAIHNETTDAARAYHSQAARHRQQLTTIEQVGYDRGLADAKAHPETLGLYARPVEEPGEVERQRGWIYFNPDAGTEWAESHPVESGEVHDAEDIRPGTAEELLKQLLPAWRELATETSRRETAEAALAETRERLEKMLRPLREDLANACSSETIVRRYHVQCVDAALAALTGDAQEAGR